uniref:Uncharacterized protein n=1 Tax=Magallana gigas TaxID=29159 RepID=K1QJK9_MAGGI
MPDQRSKTNQGECLFTRINKQTPSYRPLPVCQRLLRRGHWFTDANIGALGITLRTARFLVTALDSFYTAAGLIYGSGNIYNTHREQRLRKLLKAGCLSCKRSKKDV